MQSSSAAISCCCLARRNQNHGVTRQMKYYAPSRPPTGHFRQFVLCHGNANRRGSCVQDRAFGVCAPVDSRPVVGLRGNIGTPKNNPDIASLPLPPALATRRKTFLASKHYLLWGRHVDHGVHHGHRRIESDGSAIERSYHCIASS
jgi:hypothetical protein